jgi:hypothetical protein
VPRPSRATAPPLHHRRSWRGWRVRASDQRKRANARGPARAVCASQRLGRDEAAGHRSGARAVRPVTVHSPKDLSDNGWSNSRTVLVLLVTSRLGSARETRRVCNDVRDQPPPRGYRNPSVHGSVPRSCLRSGSTRRSGARSRARAAA